MRLATASVHSEKTLIIKLIMIIIIIIMSKSQELTVFHGHQKLIPLRIKGQKSDGRLQI